MFTNDGFKLGNQWRRLSSFENLRLGPVKCSDTFFDHPNFSYPSMDNLWTMFPAGFASGQSIFVN